MNITVTPHLEEKEELVVYGVTAEHREIPIKEIEPELKIAVKSKLLDYDKFGSQYLTTISGKKVLVISLGKEKELTGNHLRRALGKAVRQAKALRLRSFAVSFLHLFSSLPSETAGRCVAEGLLLANYRFVRYLSAEKREEQKPLEKVSLQWKGDKEAFQQGLRTGTVLAECTNEVKDLVNEPALVVSPEFLEKEARKLAGGKITVKVLNKSDMEKLGMGALLGVAAGSDRPPKLIILEYKSGSGRPIALVGKGITFDSGGYNLKPTKYIEDMKSDMAGAAAVLCTIKAAAALGLKKNLVGVMACTDNLVSGSAQKPGDIVRAYNGKTIEIGNTDAEGRLVLADALSYTEDKYQPEVMVDLATLTGSCVAALGYECAGLMGNDEALLAELEEAGRKSHDRVWAFPFFEEYQGMMDGSISDLNNCSTKGKGYEAGAISGGVFLSKFVDKAKWAHVDIAGTAYLLEDTDYHQKYATGYGVRLLCYWLMGK